MPYAMTITPMNDYLQVQVEGVFASVPEIIEFSTSYRAATVEYSLHKVLLDFTSAIFQIDYYDTVILADHASSKDFHLDGLRLAALVQEQDIKSYRLFETVAQNRCISFKAFTNAMQALEWLRRP